MCCALLRLSLNWMVMGTHQSRQSSRCSGVGSRGCNSWAHQAVICDREATGGAVALDTYGRERGAAGLPIQLSTCLALRHEGIAANLSLLGELVDVDKVDLETWVAATIRKLNERLLQ